MDIPLLRITEGVTSALNEAEPGTFNQPLSAERRYTLESELAELANLKVSVMPRSRDEGMASRARTVDTVEVDVGIQQRVDADDLTKGDVLLELAQQVSD